MRLFFIITACLAMSASFTSALAQSASQPPAQSGSPTALLQLWNQQNNACQGGAGDDPATQTACNERDSYGAQLNANGWCYGTPDQFGYQMSWHKCKNEDAANDGDSPTNSQENPPQESIQQWQQEESIVGTPQMRDCFAEALAAPEALNLLKMYIKQSGATADQVIGADYNEINELGPPAGDEIPIAQQYIDAGEPKLLVPVPQALLRDVGADGSPRSFFGIAAFTYTQCMAD
jgi:hypothetical protein